MAIIKINDLPKDQKVSREEMKKVTGGSRSSQIWPWKGNIEDYSFRVDEWGTHQSAETDIGIQPMPSPDPSACLTPGESQNGYERS